MDQAEDRRHGESALTYYGKNKPLCREDSDMRRAIVTDPVKWEVRQQRLDWLERQGRWFEPTFLTLLAAGLILQSQAIRPFPGDWLFAPIVLAGLAFLGGRYHNMRSRDMGLALDNWPESLICCGMYCLVAFALTILSLKLLQRMSVTIPVLRVESGTWMGWILYQLLYVACGEELFFRGYVLNRLLNGDRKKTSLKTAGPALVISSALFALAHVLVQGSWFGMLTFFPGLVMGWLFIRTRGLLAPILFHGLANIFYAVVTNAWF